MRRTRNLKSITFLILLFIMPFASFAQVELKGVVKDKNGVIPFANIVLRDSVKSILKGKVSDDQGNFIISADSGKYNVTISFIGYKNWSKEINLISNTSLGDIILETESEALNDVVIKGKKRLIEYKADRLVFDVENSIAAKGGDAVNAISTAPGVVVQNNSISMLGKGSSRVMVDGRIVELSGQDLIGFLKSISADDIKNIEVITNPPAKYDAAGDGGLININLKKGSGDSWKNSTILSYDQNTYGFITLRDNFLYSKNKVRLSLSAGGKLGNSRVKQSLNTYYPTGPWELGYVGKQKEDNASGRATFDYDLSKRTSIGVQYMGNYNDPSSKDNTIIRINNTGNTLDSLLINDGNRALSSSSHTFNGHLVSNLDTMGRKLSFDVDYFKFNSSVDNNFVAITYLPNMDFLNTNQSARNVSNRNIDNISATVNMEHPFKFFNLSYGGKISFIDSKSNIEYYNTISGAEVLDPGRSNEFSYKENNQVLYVEGSKNISKKLNVQLGLRFENTQTDGYSKTLNQITKNDYMKLFPTFYLSYNQSDSHKFLFNYGRRINRPDFGILNPFRSYINSNSYSEGNPFLQPSFSDKFDFSYIYKGKFRTNLFYNITTDGYGVVFTSDAVTKTQIISRQNYFKEYYYGIGETYTASIANWWDSQNTVYLLNSKNTFINNINATPRNSAQLYFNTSNTFSLSEATKIQVDYMYSSSYKRGLYGFGNLSRLNIGMKQSMLKDKMQLTLLVNDIFNTAYLKNYASIVNGIEQVYNENNSSRFFRLSLTYSFGNSKVNVKERNFGNEDEKRRSEN